MDVATKPELTARDRTAVAVIGAGAVGGLLAAAAQAAGHAVRLCVRTPISGLEIASAGKARSVAVNIVADPAAERPAPWVLLATKAQDTASAAPWLARLVGPDTTVVALQNGINHLERLRPLVGSTTIVPALVYAAVERVAPGCVVHHTGNRIVVPQGAAGARFAHMLAGGGLEVVEESDFTTAAWRKLLNNVGANPVTALTMRRIGVMREPAIRELARGLLREAVAVGRAEGARLGEPDVDEMLKFFESYNPSGGSSMLYDRLAGRSLEHDHLTGAVVRAAARHGVAVPLNQAMLALLDALDAGLRSASPAETPDRAD